MIRRPSAATVSLLVATMAGCGPAFCDETEPNYVVAGATSLPRDRPAVVEFTLCVDGVCATETLGTSSHLPSHVTDPEGLPRTKFGIGGVSGAFWRYGFRTNLARFDEPVDLHWSIRNLESKELVLEVTFHNVSMHHSNCEGIELDVAGIDDAS